MTKELERRIVALESDDPHAKYQLVLVYSDGATICTDPPQDLTLEEYAAWLVQHGPERAAHDGPMFTEVEIGGLGVDDI